MRVLHVVNISFVLPYYLGGQFHYFSSKGLKLYVACSPSNDFFEYAEKEKFIPLSVEIKREISIWSDLKAFYKLRRIIKKYQIDVVVGHTPKAALLAMLSAKSMNVAKRVYFQHGIMFITSSGIKRKFLRFMEWLTANAATQVVCVSRSVYNFSVSNNLSDVNKCLVLHQGSCNGIDLSRFSSDKVNEYALKNLKAKFGIAESDIIVGYVGRLVKDKGISELVIAFDILKERYSTLKLLLVGPIEERDSLSKEIVQKISNDNRIIHTGLVSDTRDLYVLMNIFILPSYREGLPTVVLEASAMSLPVITTRSMGCIDSIRANLTGIFTEIDPLSIADRISFYLQNPALQKKHGKAGRVFVEGNFSRQIVLKEIQKQVYKL